MPSLRPLALLVVLLIPMAARAEPAVAALADRAAEPDPAIELDCEDDPTCRAVKRADAPAGRSVESTALRLGSLVTFEPGRVRVYSKDREKLMLLAHAWQRHTQWARITIEGFDRAPGNLALAQRRADKVRNYLIRYGVAAEYLLAVGRAQPPGDASARRATGARTDLTITCCDRTSPRCRNHDPAGAALSSLE